MAELKERCPNCGGTIVFADALGMGECDCCASAFSMSDLQKIKETIALSKARIRDAHSAEGSARNETALDTSEMAELSFEVLCVKAEMALEAEQWRVAKNFVDEIICRNPKFAKAYLYRIMIDRKVFKKEALAKQEKPFDDSDSYRLLMRFGDVYIRTEMEQYNQMIRQTSQAKLLEKRYQSLCSKLQEAYRERHFNNLAIEFQRLGAYKDSARLAAECLEKYKVAHEQAKKRAAIRTVIISVCAAVTAMVVIFGLVMFIYAVSSLIAAI